MSRSLSSGWRWWGSLWSRTAAPMALPFEPAEDEELETVLAEPPGLERRAAVRHLVGRQTRCRLITLVERAPLPATIRDLSTAGVGLVFERPLQPGTFLTVGATDEHRLPVRVVFSRKMESGEWLVGCSLLQPLTPEELGELL